MGHSACHDTSRQSCWVISLIKIIVVNTLKLAWKRVMEISASNGDLLGEFSFGFGD